MSKRINFNLIVSELVQAGTLDAHSATLGNDLYLWLKGQATIYPSGKQRSPMSKHRCQGMAREYQHWHIDYSLIF